MTPYQKGLSKYIQRMADDMQLRNYSQSTINSYTYHVDKSCQHFGKYGDQIGPYSTDLLRVSLAAHESAAGGSRRFASRPSRWA